jgi:hypothetical protein
VCSSDLPKGRKKVQVQALVRVTHKNKTYEVGEIIEETDAKMIKQLIEKKLARKV